MREKSANWVVMLALMPAIMTPLIVTLSRHHTAEVRAWFVQWSGVAAQVTLVLALAALAAAIAVGVVTWRRARGRHA